MTIIFDTYQADSKDNINKDNDQCYVWPIIEKIRDNSVHTNIFLLVSRSNRKH
jgi:hypothetical protein